MTVKKITSAGRALLVLEAIAKQQPVGVSALARLLDDDKTAIQRALSTLAEHGWIRPEPGRKQAKWELTPRIHAVALMGHESSGITKLLRPALNCLRDEFNETILLTVLGTSELVLVDVAESNQMLKYVPPIGLAVPFDSAAGHAMLSRMDSKKLKALLGENVRAEFLDELEIVRQNGYAVHRFADHASVAVAVLEANGDPNAAIVLSGPLDRVRPERYETIAKRIGEVAAKLLVLHGE